MERRVRGNSHARCGVGENPEIASKDYLSLFPGAFSSGQQKGDDFRVVLEETLGIGVSGIHVPENHPWGWRYSGAAILGDFVSLCWRVLDAQYWGVPQSRKRIFLVADLGAPSSAQILFEPESLSGYSP